MKIVPSPDRSWEESSFERADRSQKKKRKKKEKRETEQKGEKLTWRSLFGTIIDHSIVSKGGVCTHYNRDIMAHQYVHTTGTEATQNVRCLVSINIGSTGCCYCRPSLVSLTLFFFYRGPYVSCVDRCPVAGRSFVSRQSAIVAIWCRQSKHRETRLFQRDLTTIPFPDLTPEIELSIELRNFS